MKNTNYKNWHRRHAKVWEIMPSPARPSMGEVAIFKKYLDDFQTGKRRKVKILILGSTPEFRDICNNERFEVTCMDINEPIYEAMTLLQKVPNKGERFINDNWLNFKTNEKYDVILGDAVTAMFPLKLYSQFFQNMNLHLVSGGLLELRLPYQDQRFKAPMGEVMENYRRFYKNQGVNIYTATYNFLVMNYLDKKELSITLSVLGEKIKELGEQGVMSKGETAALEPYYQNLTLALSYPKEDFIFSATKKYFSFLAKEFSLDYLTSYSNPVFVFQK